MDLGHDPQSIKVRKDAIGIGSVNFLLTVFLDQMMDHLVRQAKSTRPGSLGKWW
jgi:hypothetical protein